VATTEQLGTLMGDEEALRVKYDVEERHYRRNEGRQVFENPVVDFLVGEVLFDGKRWHIAVAGLLGIVAMCGVYYISMLIFAGSKVVASSSGSSVSSHSVGRKKKM